MSYEISTLPNFDRELKKLSKKYPSIKSDLLALAESLINDPFQGEGLGKIATKSEWRSAQKARENQVAPG